MDLSLSCRPSFRYALAAVLVLYLLSCCTGCTETRPLKQNADARQAAETRQRLADADKQIGMPDIVNFTERKLARDILELRDQESLSTWTYIVNLNGERIFLGRSIGYGLPCSVQFTNPEKVEVNHWSGVNGAGGYYGTLPQADPNGLFMPDGLSATWILLIGPDGEAHPVYVEPEILVSPFPLHDVDTGSTD